MACLHFNFHSWWATHCWKWHYWTLLTGGKHQSNHISSQAFASRVINLSSRFTKSEAPLQSAKRQLISMALPSYLNIDEIHAQLNAKGHDVTQDEVERLLQDLGFGDPHVPLPPPLAAPTNSSEPCESAVLAADLETRINSTEDPFRASMSPAPEPAATAADAFEWHGVAGSGRLGLSRLLISASKLPQAHSDGDNTCPPPPRTAALTPLLGQRTQPVAVAALDARPPPERAPSSKPPRPAKPHTESAERELQRLYSSLYQAAAAANTPHVTGSGSGSASRRASSAGSPRSVAATSGGSAGSSRRTSASGSDAPGPAAPSTGRRSIGARPRKSDPVARYQQLQRQWQRDAFLRNSERRRPKDGFAQLFAALHAAEAARGGGGQ